MAEHKVEIGSGDSVVIDHLFGPTGLANLRVTADTERVGWVIERWLDVTGGGICHVCQWVEWCFIPGQLSIEYDEE